MSAVKYWLLFAAVLALAYGSSFALKRGRAGSSASHSAGAAGSPLTKPVPGKQTNSFSDTEAATGPLPAFTLTDQDGKPFDTASLRGRVWLASFFFANCPSICWRLNGELAAIQQQQPEGKLHLVSITCDPDNDTPPALKKYAERFEADPKRWTFLTGSMGDIRKVGRDIFKVAVEKETHSSRVFVIDGEGKVRGRFQVTDPQQLAFLKELLATLESEK